MIIQIKNRLMQILKRIEETDNDEERYVLLGERNYCVQCIEELEK